MGGQNPKNSHLAASDVSVKQQRGSYVQRTCSRDRPEDRREVKYSKMA